MSETLSWIRRDGKMKVFQKQITEDQRNLCTVAEIADAESLEKIAVIHSWMCLRVAFKLYLCRVTVKKDTSAMALS